jgi:hypothetical protein
MTLPRAVREWECVHWKLGARSLKLGARSRKPEAKSPLAAGREQLLVASGFLPPAHRKSVLRNWMKKLRPRSRGTISNSAESTIQAVGDQCTRVPHM